MATAVAVSPEDGGDIAINGAVVYEYPLIQNSYTLNTTI